MPALASTRSKVLSRPRRTPRQELGSLLKEEDMASRHRRTADPDPAIRLLRDSSPEAEPGPALVTSEDPLQYLQRTIGNDAVNRLIEQQAVDRPVRVSRRTDASAASEEQSLDRKDLAAFQSLVARAQRLGPREDEDEEDEGEDMGLDDDTELEDENLPPVHPQASRLATEAAPSVDAVATDTSP